MRFIIFFVFFFTFTSILPHMGFGVNENILWKVIQTHLVLQWPLFVFTWFEPGKEKKNHCELVFFSFKSPVILYTFIFKVLSFWPVWYSYLKISTSTSTIFSRYFLICCYIYLQIHRVFLSPWFLYSSIFCRQTINNNRLLPCHHVVLLPSQHFEYAHCIFVATAWHYGQ